MGSYGFFLLLFIVPNTLSQSSMRSEINLNERNSSLYAKEDVSKSLETLGPYGPGFGEKWVVMPDGDGNAIMSVIGNKKVQQRTLLYTDVDLNKKITFILYTPEEPEGLQFRLKNLTNVKLNPSRTTRIISHGWMAGANTSIAQEIKDEFLATKNSDVIAVDWEPFSHDFTYLLAVNAVPNVGKHVGRLIDELVKTKNISYKNVHIVGHSLGAHVAGFAGASTKEKIGRITGLDPALPCFQNVRDSSGHLDSSDAEFVDVIHTCSGLLGFSIPLGHVDFYPNGGSPFQPGCDSDGSVPGATQSCSHSRSHHFFAESINPKSRFTAVKCKDWYHFKRQRCENVFAEMGERVPRNATGIFYLKTNPESPFSMGMLGTKF